MSHRVAEGLKLIWKCRRWGVMLTRTGLVQLGHAGLLKLLHGAKVPQSILGICEDQWEGFELALSQEQKLHEQVCELAARDKVMAQVAELPGYGPIRAATLISYLDTPWRFKSKSALWKYVGIGLHREKSGTGLDIVCVEQACNRLLRNVTLGAAQSAIEQKENVFARRYGRWVQSGLSPRNARRNVARDQVTAIWGMWKTNKPFDQTMLADPLDG